MTERAHRSCRPRLPSRTWTRPVDLHPRDLDDDRNSPPIYDSPVAMSHFEALSRPTIGDLEERKSMKRHFAIILAALAAAALFGGLVYAVLMAAHVSEPAATTVHGLTPRR